MGAGYLVKDKAQLAKAEGPLKSLRAAAAACPLVPRNSDFVQDLQTKMIMGMMIVMTTTGGGHAPAWGLLSSSPGTSFA